MQKNLLLLQKTESKLISELKLMQIQQKEIFKKKNTIKNIEIFKLEAQKTKEVLIFFVLQFFTFLKNIKILKKFVKFVTQKKICFYIIFFF